MRIRGLVKHSVTNEAMCDIVFSVTQHGRRLILLMTAQFCIAATAGLYNTTHAIATLVYI